MDRHLGEPEVSEVLEAYAAATGFPAGQVDAEGCPAVEAKDLSEFCRRIRQTAEGEIHCQASLRQAAREAVRFGFPYIFRCHAGLINWAAPLLPVGEGEVGALVAGGVLLWSPDDFFGEEVGQTAAALGLPAEELRAAVPSLPRVDPRRVKGAADTLLFLAARLRPSAALTERQRITAEQARFGALLEGRKRRRASDNDHYPLQTERALADLYRLGDREAALGRLNELIADLLARYGAEPVAIRARFSEVLVLLARAAAEGGADFERVAACRTQAQAALAGPAEIGELSHQLIRAAEELLEEVIRPRSRKHHRLLERVHRYVEAHDGAGLSLGEVARAVDLSPGYLSHIFKDELGCTVGQYITGSRIARAKALLQEGGTTAREVAERTGFKDQSHFSRVFRKETGLTPTEYRRRLG